MWTVRPVTWLQFALLGAIYAERVLKVPNPNIGLLNIGAEEGKGNELTKEAHRLLRATSLNFRGNVEAKMFLNTPWTLWSVTASPGMSC